MHTNPQALDPRHTPDLILFGIEDYCDLFCQKDEHVKRWRWHWYCRGVEIRSNGRRYDLRGEPL